MSSTAASLAQVLVQQTEEDVLQALQLYMSVWPEFHKTLRDALVEMPMKRYSGKIASFNHQKCFGFIESEEGSAEFGKDTFVSDREIGEFNTGDAVWFTAVVNKENKPQARLLQSADGKYFAAPSVALVQTAQQSVMPAVARRPSPCEPPALKVPRLLSPQPVTVPRFHPPQPVTVPPPLRHGAAGPAFAAAAGELHNGDEAILPGRFTGTIFEFNFDKHYGFISCDKVQQQFGRDIFLAEQELGTFHVGDVVTFKVAVRGGKPQARNLLPQAVCVPRRIPATQIVATPPAASTGWASAGEDWTRYNGVMKSFSPEKHYGFIESAEAFAVYGKDIFLSDKEIADFSVGCAVSFRVVQNAQGKPQARELQPGA